MVGAGLLVKSFARLRGVDPGFQPGSVLVFDVGHPAGRYRERSALVGFYDRLFEGLLALPGVRGVAASYDPPLASNWYQSFDLPGTAPRPREDRGALFRTVTPGYFATLGVEVIEGRRFTEADDVGAAGAVIVNEAFARRFSPERSLLGRAFAATTTQWRWGEAVPREFRVVGLVEDEIFGDLGKPPQPAFYVPFRQTPHERMSVLVRTAVDPQTLVPEVRRLLRGLDPALPMARVTTLSDIQSAAVARPRFRTLVLGAFAGSSLLLALIGLVGVLSDTVAQRRPGDRGPARPRGRPLRRLLDDDGRGSEAGPPRDGPRSQPPPSPSGDSSPDSSTGWCRATPGLPGGDRDPGRGRSARMLGSRVARLAHRAHGRAPRGVTSAAAVWPPLLRRDTLESFTS